MIARSVPKATNTCTIEHFASVLGHDENKLLVRMRADAILLPFGRPYQGHVNRGYFRVQELGNNRVSVLLTSKGQIWLARKYPQGADLSGDGA